MLAVSRLQHRALPDLGELVLAKVRPSHIRTLVRNLKAKVGQGRAQLAPRTVFPGCGGRSVSKIISGFSDQV